MPTKPLTIVVAINPSASFGKSKSVGPAVVSTLRGLGHTVNSLTEPNFAELVASGKRAVAAKPDALVVVGGDGMVSLGTNLVAGTKVPLGIVPSGTGNDMARGLGIPHDNTEAAIEMLAEALGKPPRVIDAAIIRHRDDFGQPKETWFACVLSAGFDAIVNERANKLRHPKGPNRYLLALAIELAKLKPIQYRLVLDGIETVTKAALVAVGNSVSLGGGMKVTPNASLTDGQLDVLVVQPLSRIAFLRIFPRVFKGAHITDPRVAIHLAGKILIDAENVAAYADGERVGLLPIEIEVVPGALRVLAPLPSASLS